MSPIAPRRIASPMLLGGPHTPAFLDAAQALGFTGAQRYASEIGEASATKMCRSVIIKGLEALLVESLVTARHYGVEEAVLASLRDLLPGADWPKLAHYMISRAVQHGARRAEEMREAARTVEAAGLDPAMSTACVRVQDWASAFSRRPRARHPRPAARPPARRRAAAARRKAPMLIIDCHGHYTTAPEPHDAFREAQIARRGGPAQPHRGQRRRSATTRSARAWKAHSCKLQRERGTDLTHLLAARLGHGAPHRRRGRVSQAWTRACNDLITRVVRAVSRTTSSACASCRNRRARRIANSRRGAGALRERAGLRRLQSQSRSVRRALDLAAADRPALVSASTKRWSSSTCRRWSTCPPRAIPNFHATGAHYINADTTAFMQFIQGDLFKDFPTLRFIIPHGGGAVPYHWGRYRGLRRTCKRPPLAEHVMRNVFFDTCVYHQPGIELLLEVIPIDNILFGSEMVGAVRGIDPRTGPLLRRHQALYRRARSVGATSGASCSS